MGLSHVICACQPWQLAAVHGAVHLGRVPTSNREMGKLEACARSYNNDDDDEL